MGMTMYEEAQALGVEYVDTNIYIIFSVAKYLH
jgi:hypothetical protein